MKFMKRTAAISVLAAVGCCFLAGCSTTPAESGVAPASVTVPEKKLQEMTCAELDHSLMANYIMVAEFEIMSRNMELPPNHPRYDPVALAKGRKKAKEEVIDPAIAKFRASEKEYKSRCKGEPGMLKAAKASHHSKYLGR